MAIGPPTKPYQYGVAVRPFLGEPKAGDAGLVIEEDDGLLGAAAGIARVDRASNALRYAGVGNTVIRRIGPEPGRLVSRDGTLGQISRTPREEILAFGGKDVILLYTDGSRDLFEIERYTTFATDSAAAIARNIVRLFGKPHDDATCIALRPAQ